MSDAVDTLARDIEQRAQETDARMRAVLDARPIVYSVTIDRPIHPDHYVGSCNHAKGICDFAPKAAK